MAAERLYHLPGGADPVASVAVLHPAATSLARLGGARVLAGARPEDAERCRAAGAAEALDYRDPDLLALRGRIVLQVGPAGA